MSAIAEYCHVPLTEKSKLWILKQTSRISTQKSEFI